MDIGGKGRIHGWAGQPEGDEPGIIRIRQRHRDGERVLQAARIGHRCAEAVDCLVLIVQSGAGTHTNLAIRIVDAELCRICAGKRIPPRIALIGVGDGQGVPHTAIRRRVLRHRE